MTDDQKEVIKSKLLANKTQKKKGVGKVVTIADYPTIPPDSGTEFGKGAHKKSKKNDRAAVIIRIV